MAFSNAFRVNVIPTLAKACLIACNPGPLRYWCNIRTPALDPTLTPKPLPARSRVPTTAIRNARWRASSVVMSYPNVYARHMHISTWSFIQTAVSVVVPPITATAVPTPGTTPDNAVVPPTTAACLEYRLTILSATRNRCSSSESFGCFLPLCSAKPSTIRQASSGEIAIA